MPSVQAYAVFQSFFHPLHVPGQPANEQGRIHADFTSKSVQAMVVSRSLVNAAARPHTIDLNQTFFLYGPLKLDGSEVQAFTNIPKMAFFVHVSCLSFKIWEAPRHLLDVRRLGDGKIIVPPLAKLT